MGGAFVAYMGGAVMESCCFVWKNAKKNAGLQGSILSDHCMATGFGSIELPTCGLLQRGRDHSPPTASVADPRGGNTGHIPPPRAVKRTSLGPRAGCSYVH